MSTEKTKILYVITKSNFGGAQRYVYDLATNIPTGSFTPVVAFGGTGEKHAKTGTLKERLEAKKVRCIPITHFMRDVSLLQDLRAFFEVFSIIRKERPDVLHVTSSKAGGMGVLAGRIAKVPKIIFTSHGLAYDETWRPSWQRILIKLSTWVTILLSTKTIQITQDTYKRASNLFFAKNKNILIYNGREIPHFFSRKEAREMLQNGTDLSQAPWIGTLAELTKNKNLDVLIDAVAYMHTQGNHVHLWILGDGEERDRLIAQAQRIGIAPYVHVMGYVENASRILKAFDIFTLPSKKEGLPYVLLEAGFAALPVVVSDIHGIRDIVTHEKTGLMVKADPVLLGQALTTLITETEHAHTYGEALCTDVYKKFSIENMILQTTALYSASNPSTSLSNIPRCTECS